MKEGELKEEGLLQSFKRGNIYEKDSRRKRYGIFGRVESSGPQQQMRGAEIKVRRRFKCSKCGLLLNLFNNSGICSDCEKISYWDEYLKFNILGR